MPIYEFYCNKCNTVYKFFSRTVNTDKTPNCPKCTDIKLERNLSTFATISRRGDDAAADTEMPALDEARMEKAMAMLANEADKINENDPRQAAKLMRKLSDETGLNLGPGMEEALNRLEKGENPEKVEEEMGDLLDGDEDFIMAPKSKKGHKSSKPNLDDKLYDL